MPTGYTADIATGKITEFNQYAWMCARAFGAMVSLRDERAEPVRPEKFQPGTYNAQRLTEAKAELERLQSMTPGEMVAARDEAEAERAAMVERRNAERLAQRDAYENMLAQVWAWEPPTAEHVELKEFMGQQLLESIDFDCRPIDQHYPALPKPRDWHAEAVKKAIQDIEYHSGAQAQEEARVESRNRWVESLAASLEPTTRN